MQRSRRALLLHDISPIYLRKHIKIPKPLHSGLVKCRIVYGEKVEDVKYTRYTPKKINLLKLIEDNSIDYLHKFLDRNHINNLYEQRGDCDDIIIVKKGMLTDSSYSNIALCRDGKWYTPSKCLLKGTRRQQLIDQGRLVEADIRADSIEQYDKLCLINAMIPLGSLQVDIRNCH